MTTAPESTLLHEDQLEDEEARALEAIARGEDVPTAVLTVEQAIVKLRRIRYHLGKIEEIKAQDAALIAPLVAEIQRIKEWTEERLKDREGSIRFHEAALQAFYRANRPTGKVMMLKLPGGVIEYESPKTQFDFGNSKQQTQLALWLKEQNMTQFYRSPDPELQKVDLKKALVEQDGRVLLRTGDGELIPMEMVKTVEIPEKITVKVEDKPKPPKAG